jgi:hypothetical protein
MNPPLRQRSRDPFEVDWEIGAPLCFLPFYVLSGCCGLVFLHFHLFEVETVLHSNAGCAFHFSRVITAGVWVQAGQPFPSFRVPVPSDEKRFVIFCFWDFSPVFHFLSSSTVRGTPRARRLKVAFWELSFSLFVLLQLAPE